jgi:hypothetical protein
MRLRLFTGAWTEREFRLLFNARALSLLGDNIAPVALAFAVLDLTGSASDLGYVLAARTVPLVVLLLAGGVWADRLPRQRLMMLSDVGRFLTQGLVAALLVSDRARLWELILLQALNGIATAFFNPASTALTPQTIRAELLQQANALLSLASSTFSIVGPICAGILVAGAGPGWAIAADAATFAGSALFLLRLRVDETGVRPPRKSFVGELADGWREVRRRQWVGLSILDFMAFQLFFLPAYYVLGPLIAKQSLGGASAWAAIATAAGAGALLGDLLSFRLRPRRPLVSMVSFLALGLPLLILFGMRQPIMIVAAAAVAYGLGVSVADTLWFTALQRGVPEHALSRVSSYDWMGSMVLRPIGFAMVGPIAAAVGVETTLIGAASVTGIAQVATLLSPRIRDFAGDPHGTVNTYRRTRGGLIRSSRRKTRSDQTRI